MLRKIIKINEDACTGCGLCSDACHEGAIAIVNGKAKLMREDYCDGLGNCLPVCPVNAISFEEREAPAFDEEAVKKSKDEASKSELPCGCPGTHSKSIVHAEKCVEPRTAQEEAQSRLSQWPVQIRLAPVNAPYFRGANLLIAADCSAYAYGDFHIRFIKNRITLIGCPKLDDTDYSVKLTEIIKMNDIKSVTVVRMEVPCCGGIESAVKLALKNSDKMIPWQVVTISTDGKILD
ncbi:MAG: 4Fe-4S ferredoxin [Firmicutes bacterium HGW-Firmicutes-16]|nr:MAG: 4Fe-4S ferredoxin [Firmicutes bacterium HGW-Firmicutes-16]